MNILHIRRGSSPPISRSARVQRKAGANQEVLAPPELSRNGEAVRPTHSFAPLMRLHVSHGKVKVTIGITMEWC